MDPSEPAAPAIKAPRRRRLALGLVALAAVAGAAGWFAWRADRDRREFPFSTPYENARPGVAYVGDAACARCHSEIARTYREHPMGRSLAPTSEAAWAL